MNQKRFIIGRWIAAVLALIAFSAAIYHVIVDNQTKGEVRTIEGYTPWSEEVLEAAAKLPVQDGGRIKPLSTYAGFTMLQLHGARSMKVMDDKGEEHKLEPTAWLLDTLFRPALGMDMPTFRLDNDEVLDAIGVESRGRRDRYSYTEIDKGRQKLSELARAYSQVESDDRTPMQNQVLDLEQNVRIYETLFVYFNFARSGIIMVGSGGGSAPDQRANVSAFMTMAPQLKEELNRIQHSGEGMSPQMQSLLEQITQQSNFSKFSLFPFPPVEAGEDKWNSAGELIWTVMMGEHKDPETAIADIAVFEALARSVGDQKEFLAELGNVQDHIDDRAKGIEEAGRVGLEYQYYQADWFLNAMVLFLIGSLTALAMWALGQSLPGRIAYWATVLFTSLSTLCITIAIVKRCVVMQRSIIGNLYDTIIFIAVSVAILSLVVEWMTRRRFALGIGPILGTALIILARRYELGDASDHMDPLPAVLDSNYWLTVHVITITLGYAAGLLSAFLSAVYVLMRGLGLDQGSKDAQRMLSRVVYGMLCFTLLLSLVGTVLGGIWANDSWGRFWGWDPKENGALLIVLWLLAILHARLGGYIKEWGMHITSLFTAVIVTFSWWHVNFLNVGLHSYGFTSNQDTIWTFYKVIVGMMIFAIVVAWVEKAGKTHKPDHAGKLDEPKEAKLES